MKKDINHICILVLVLIFIGFYLLTSYLLDKRNMKKTTKVEVEETVVENTHEEEQAIALTAYQNVRVLYDVVNSKFKVSQEDIITKEEITYKKIINYDEVMNDVFTEMGKEEYLAKFNNYFMVTADGYYIAGNLVSYQTYYFRGDDTTLYVIDSTDDEIKAIVYEKWTSNNKSTLGLIDVVKENDKWLVNSLSILASN